MTALNIILEHLASYRDQRQIPTIAKSAGIPRRSVQSILDGKVPSLTRAESIAAALGLEFYIGPPRDGGDGGTRPTAGLATFHPETDVEVRGYAKCSIVGHLEDETQYRDLPMPTGLREIDAESFFVIARGPSMIPEGIEEGDYCLVSPNTPLAAGLRVWLKDRQGKACIKRLMEVTDRTYKLRGWQPPKGGRQTSYDDEWMIPNIAGRGVVLAVYRGKPDVRNPPPIIPDPRAPAAASPATLPREIADALGVSADASIAEVIKAIEARSAGGFDAGALEEKMAAVVRAETEAQTEALRQEATAAQETQTESLRAELAAVRESLADASALARQVSDPESDAGGDPPGARPVDVIELNSAAGGGADILSEEVSGRVWFRRDWLDEHGLDAPACAVIGVAGESMEPTLMDGSKILVDRARTDWRQGDIFVLRTDDGLVVKRAGADGARRLMVSDNPAWGDVPLADDAEIIGRVVWTARMLVGGG